MYSVFTAGRTDCAHCIRTTRTLPLARMRTHALHLHLCGACHTLYHLHICTFTFATKEARQQNGLWNRLCRQLFRAAGRTTALPATHAFPSYISADL